MSRHPPELVERVADALEETWVMADPGRESWCAMARYALDMAERAARDGACRTCSCDEYDTDEQAKAKYESDVALSVRSAVEGA